MNARTRTTGILLGLLALGVAGLGAALAVRLQGAGRTAPAPAYWEAPAFALTDQTGATLAREDLAGTVWLASFIYTNCPDFCPLITRRMARLRDALAADGLLGGRVRLLSITVDPERDTPEVLRAYATGFGAEDPREWAFLTGAPDAVRSVVVDGFKLPVLPPMRPGDHTVAHSDRIALVDAAGRVRGLYSATDPAEQGRLDRELRALLRE